MANTTTTKKPAKAKPDSEDAVLAAIAETEETKIAKLVKKAVSR